MPGLKALTDRLPPGDSSRSVTLYTASFSVGVGLSFLVSQFVADRFGWRTALFVTGLGPIAMVAVCRMLAPFKPQRHSDDRVECCCSGHWRFCNTIAFAFTGACPVARHHRLN